MMANNHYDSSGITLAANHQRTQIIVTSSLQSGLDFEDATSCLPVASRMGRFLCQLNPQVLRLHGQGRRAPHSQSGAARFRCDWPALSLHCFRLPPRPPNCRHNSANWLKSPLCRVRSMVLRRAPRFSWIGSATLSVLIGFDAISVAKGQEGCQCSNWIGVGSFRRAGMAGAGDSSGIIVAVGHRDSSGITMVRIGR